MRCGDAVEAARPFRAASLASRHVAAMASAWPSIALRAARSERPMPGAGQTRRTSLFAIRGECRRGSSPFLSCQPLVGPGRQQCKFLLRNLQIRPIDRRSELLERGKSKVVCSSPGGCRPPCWVGAVSTVECTRPPTVSLFHPWQPRTPVFVGVLLCAACLHPPRCVSTGPVVGASCRDGK